MPEDCIFCKIVQEEIPAKIVYEDELVIAFDDVHAQAPIHKLIIPREHIETINDLTPEHDHLIGHMIQVAKNLALGCNIDQSGYRLVMNCNAHAGQMVYHLHLHLIGGRALTWPPG